VKRLEYTLGIVGVIIVAILWFGNRKAECAPPLKGYGGKLSAQSMAVMSGLCVDLEESLRIRSAEHDRIVLECRDGITEYRFAYGALWKNQQVVLPLVKAFHFEYRGPTSHCVTAESDHANIESVGFAVRIQENDKEIAAFAKIRVKAIGNFGPVQLASISQ
jgi:hypothetical protein